MKNEKMLVALNNQINAEIYSSYLYLSMAAYFESMNLKGLAKWLSIQSHEEWEHAMKFYNFIHDRRWQVKLQAVAAPEVEWKSPLAVFEAAFAHEQKVTAMINNLVDLAIDTKDHATQSFLQWFVDEQVEEEANADANVQMLKMVGDRNELLFMVDQQLGQRK